MDRCQHVLALSADQPTEVGLREEQHDQRRAALPQLTALASRLPFGTSKTPSQLSLEGEVATSRPQFLARNNGTAYIDPFEIQCFPPREVDEAMSSAGVEYPDLLEAIAGLLQTRSPRLRQRSRRRRSR